MTAPKITVNGTIKRIVQLETRKGIAFLRVHVVSPKLKIDVDIFNPDQRRQLDDAMPGDRLRATGFGYHKGPVHRGTTSLSARSITHQRDDAERALRARPEQLSLFTS